MLQGQPGPLTNLASSESPVMEWIGKVVYVIGAMHMNTLNLECWYIVR